MKTTRVEHSSRRFLRLNYAIEWVTTHLQEIPQVELCYRMGYNSPPGDSSEN